MRWNLKQGIVTGSLLLALAVSAAPAQPAEGEPGPIGSLARILIGESKDAPAKTATAAPSAPPAPAPVAVEPKITLAGGEGLDGRVSITVREMDLAQAVRLLAEQSGVNVAVGKDVKGAVTCSLADVTVRHALEAFLRANGFTFVERGGVLIVVKEGEDKDFEKKAVARTVVRKTFHVPYTGAEQEFTAGAAAVTKKSDAKGIEQTLRDMLTNRGKMAYYERQHLVVVEDDEEAVALIEEFINTLWRTPTQVHIDSRLIEVSLEEGEDLGLRWSVQKRLSKNGRVDHDTALIDTLGTLAKTTGPSTGLERFYSFGIINANVEIVLEALGTRKRVDLQSNPAVLVTNHRTASIVVGQEVPYIKSEESTGGSAIRTVEFKEVAVRLDVTPHVSPNDEVVFLDVHPSVKSVIGYTEDPVQPILSTREAVTNVAIRSGSTLILGGLVQRNRSNQRSEMPFIARIPVVGLLFRQRSFADSKNDLLFLMTPTVVTPDVVQGLVQARPNLMRPVPEHHYAPYDSTDPFGEKRKAGAPPVNPLPEPPAGAPPSSADAPAIPSSTTSTPSDASSHPPADASEPSGPPAETPAASEPSQAVPTP